MLAFTGHLVRLHGAFYFAGNQNQAFILINLIAFRIQNSSYLLRFLYIQSHYKGLTITGASTTTESKEKL